MTDKPTGRFLRELEEVAHDAAALRDHICRGNAPLPPEFPDDYVGQLCTMLEALPSVSVDAALHGLSMGRVRVPTLRSTYLPADAGDDPDRHPDNDRGGLLDLRLKALLGSISSAIAQYEDDTGNRLDLEITPDDSLSAEDQAGLGLSDLVKAAKGAEAEVGAFESAIDEVPEEEKSEQLEALDQQLADTDLGLKAARAEASHPRPKARLLKKAGTWLGRRADEALTLLENAETISEPGLQALSNIGQRTLAGFINDLRDTMKNVQDIARATRETGHRISSVLAAKRAQGPPPKDFDIDEVHRMILAGREPPESWWPFITNLTFFNEKDFSDLSPVQNLIRLQKLDLMDTRVSDLSALSGLKELQELQLWLTKVVDLSPLSGLTELKKLNLPANPISDLSPLSGLTKLQSLYLSGTLVSDLSPLSGLTGLRHLNLDRTKILDLTALSGLTGLLKLDLMNTQISDLSGLSGLMRLESLRLYNSPVSDLSPLSGLTGLKSLDLGGTKVSDVSALSGLVGLESVSFWKTQVTDLSPLQHLIDNGLSVADP